MKLLLVLLLSVGFSAQAGFHMEPYLGLTLTGDWEQGTNSGSLNQTHYGIKLGYQAPIGLQVGGDIQLSLGTYDSLAANNDNLDGATAAVGPYIGYQSAFGLRGSLTYIFTSALVINDINNTSLSGSGFKFSAGYSFLKWLAVNLEYHMMTYDEFDDDNTTGLTALPADFTGDFIMVSVSFPFNFGGGK